MIYQVDHQKEIVNIHDIQEEHRYIAMMDLEELSPVIRSLALMKLLFNV